jgi:hypothetical protein
VKDCNASLTFVRGAGTTKQCSQNIWNNNNIRVPCFVLFGDPTPVYERGCWVAGQDSNSWLLDALIAPWGQKGIMSRVANWTSFDHGLHDFCIKRAAANGLRYAFVVEIA